MKESPIDENAKSAQRRSRWIILAFLKGTFFTLLIGYIDFEIISPLVLPEDPCYYHFHHTPLWVEVLYMGMGNNGHPSITLTHILLLPLLGYTLAHFLVRWIRLSLK